MNCTLITFVAAPGASPTSSRRPVLSAYRTDRLVAEWLNSDTLHGCPEQGSARATACEPGNPRHAVANAPETRVRRRGRFTAASNDRDPELYTTNSLPGQACRERRGSLALLPSCA